ncbi:hypothetical protein AWZ03_004048 [Drosophila navojoa]|uniref:Uncharacterized protein n=1 Tax=Drosophila navojoa TaxID=7232 RepID=A0A484BL88_DRONA|nr:prisilkin-39 [Drosophila navojoa]TDG49557.1 hypothetical protein AWZ03_004048 [Drosophila navojoa]
MKFALYVCVLWCLLACAWSAPQWSGIGSTGYGFAPFAGYGNYASSSASAAASSSYQGYGGLGYGWPGNGYGYGYGNYNGGYQQQFNQYQYNGYNNYNNYATGNRFGYPYGFGK